MPHNASRSVIVGTGLAGLYAACELARNGEKVVLIERAPEIGGMLRSVADENGAVFDIGTHFAIATNDPGIDDVLFNDLGSLEMWAFEESLKEGHYFSSRLNTETGCIDIRTLTDADLDRAREEILARTEAPDAPRTALERVLQDYGPTLAGRVFAPVLYKLTGRELDDLAPGVIDQFSLSRLVAFDSGRARELKRDPVFDAKLAFARRADGSSSLTKFYPRSGGIGSWLEAVREKVDRLGADFRLNANLTRLKIENGRVRSVMLDDGEHIPCSRLFWTGPAEILLILAGLKPQGKPPVFCDLMTFNIATEAPLATDLHWVCNYDSSFASYRITQYPNITRGPVPPPPHHVTVEVILRPGHAEPDGRLILDELKLMGLAPREARLKLVSQNRYPKALPVPAPGHELPAEANRKTAAGIADNIILAGRASGHFHQIPVLKHARVALKECGLNLA